MSYPLVIAGACMGDVINSRTYGAMAAVGAAVDVVAAPAGMGGGYAYECNLITNGNDGHFRASPYDPTSLTIGGEGSVIRQWAFGRFLVKDNLPTSDAIIAYFPRETADSLTNAYILRQKTDGTLELWYNGATLWATGSTVFAYDAAVDWKILFDHSGLNFWAKVYVNGSSTPEIDTSGDTKQPGAYIFRMYVGEDLDAGVNRGAKFYHKNISFFEQDADPGWPKIAALTVDGQGTYTDFTGDYTAVDEVPPDGITSAISTNTTSKKESVTLISCDTAGIPADSTFHGVRSYGWHTVADAGKFAGYPFFKQGATEVDGNSDAPSTAFVLMEGDSAAETSLRRLAPDGSALTRAIIDALEIGWRTAAADHTASWAISQGMIEVLYSESEAAPTGRSWAAIF